MRQILLLGDSMTAFSYKKGWVTKLAAAFESKANVVNAGVCGYNTRWILDNLRSDKPYIPPTQPGQEPPLCAVLWMGGNDCAADDSPEAIPYDEYLANFKAIVEWVRMEVRPEHGVLIVSPVPPNAAQWDPIWLPLKDTMEGWAPSVRRVAVSRAYAQGAVEVAKDVGAPVINMFDVFKVSADATVTEPHWEHMFDDGLHFNEKGHGIAFNAIMEAFKGKLGLDPAALPADVPLMPNSSAMGGDVPPCTPYTTPHMPKIVMMGDALTASGFHSSSPWMGNLARHFSHCAQMVNAGLGAGYTTQWVADNLTRGRQPFVHRMIGREERPMLTNVWFGAGDAAAGVPVDEFHSNLMRITRWARDELGSQHTMLVTPPPLAADAGSSTHLYRDAVLSVAKETNTFAVDLHQSGDQAALPCWDWEKVQLKPQSSTAAYKAILSGAKTIMGDPAAIQPFTLPYVQMAAADRLRPLCTTTTTTTTTQVDTTSGKRLLNDPPSVLGFPTPSYTFAS